MPLQQQGCCDSEHCPVPLVCCCCCICIEREKDLILLLVQDLWLDLKGVPLFVWSCKSNSKSHTLCLMKFTQELIRLQVICFSFSASVWKADQCGLQLGQAEWRQEQTQGEGHPEFTALSPHT